MEALVQALKEKNLTIASIESLTAGMFSASLANVPGASSVLKGALITYWTEVKVDVLGIDQDIIETYGVVSQETAYAMAKRGQEMFQCDIAVSFTGNAGPDALEGKPVGLVCMGINYRNEIYTFEALFEGERNAIRKQACLKMAEEILKRIQ